MGRAPSIGTDGGPALTPPPDGAVRAAQEGDEGAMRALYHDVQPRILRYLRALVGDEAEDVASETWLQIIRDFDAFSGDLGGFRGWAATVARNRALDHLRGVRRRPAADQPVEELIDLVADADTARSALESISTDAAVALIATLPRDQAEAVLLRAVLGLDAKTAGRVMGKRAGAVRTSAYRGLKTLQERLNEGEAGWAP